MRINLPVVHPITTHVRRAVVAVATLSALLGASPWAAAGQEPDEGEVQEWAPPPPPSIFQIPIRAIAVADSAAQAQQMVRRLITVGGLEVETEEAEASVGELQALIASTVDLEVIRLERLSRLRDQALIEDSRLESIRGRLTARLDQLDAVRARWLEREQVWTAWQDSLRDEANYAVVEADVAGALQRIDEVLVTTSAAGGDLLALQRRVEALRTDIADVGAAVAGVRSRRREALLERTQPVLFSRGHRTELVRGGWQAWDPTAPIEPAAYMAFFRDHLGLLGLHVLLAVLLGVAVRRVRTHVADDEAWGGLLDSPFTLGIFASVVLAMVRVTLAPPLWDVFLWILFGAAAARLSQQLIADRALRRVVYLLAAFYPVLLLLEVGQLPEAVLRLVIVVAAAAAIPLFLILAGDRTDGDHDPERVSTRAWALRVGAGVWGAILLAMVVGFDALGRWLLHAAVMTAAVSFVVVLAFVLVNAAAARVSRRTGARSLWRRAASLLVQRAIVLFRIVLIVAAVLLLLDVWGVAESPLAIWRRITELGFTVGELRLTVGRLILGMLVIYGAVILSGLVRSLLVPDPEGPLRPGQPSILHEADRGLGLSISKLAHYALITLGLIFAVAAMGVELQNFAIVAGALGIGVGFGLQNVVNNFASGLILLMERPVRVGDTVVVGDVWGTIQKIGLRSTVMVTLEQSEMIVPNGDLVSEKVINWTLSSPIARIIMPVGAAYGSPVAEVLRIMEEAAFAHESVLHDPPPEAIFVEFGDSALNFELRIWVQNIRRRLEVRSAVLADVDRRFREAGIEIPFPQRDLHLRSIDPGALEQLRQKS